MGRIIRDAELTTASGGTSAKALVDTGAERTVVPYAKACEAGFAPRRALRDPQEATGAVPGERLVGYRLPVTVTVVSDGGRRKEATVNAFVPRAVRTRNGKLRRLRPGEQPESMTIGADFLQGARAQLKFRPTGRGRDRFDGVDAYGGLRVQPASPAVARAFKKLFANETCPVPRKKSRRRR